MSQGNNTCLDVSLTSQFSNDDYDLAVGIESNQDTGMLPVTVKQIKNARADIRDGRIIIDRRYPGVVTIVGKIIKVDKHTTHTVYSVDDGTGQLSMYLWSPVDVKDAAHRKITNNEEKNLVDGRYVRCIGGIRDHNGERSLTIYGIRLVTDFNEITYHNLDVLFNHLKNSNPALAKEVLQNQDKFRQSNNNSTNNNSNNTCSIVNGFDEKQNDEYFDHFFKECGDDLDHNIGLDHGSIKNNEKDNDKDNEKDNDRDNGKSSNSNSKDDCFHEKKLNSCGLNNLDDLADVSRFQGHINQISANGNDAKAADPERNSDVAGVFPFTQQSESGSNDNIGSSPLSTKILAFIQETQSVSDQDSQGCHVDEIFKALPNEDKNDIREVLENLTNDGNIYTTIDEEHYQVC